MTNIQKKFHAMNTNKIKKGIKTKSNPHGITDKPFHPGKLTLGANGTFFARVSDTNTKMMQSIFVMADQHRGTSMIEILQNCVIFNGVI